LFLSFSFLPGPGPSHPPTRRQKALLQWQGKKKKYSVVSFTINIFSKKEQSVKTKNKKRTMMIVDLHDETKIEEIRNKNRG
jgi:hypothetical protein